jgi:hypothetical protein
MGLYHFNWKGQEHTVALHRKREGGIGMLFLDEVITATLGTDRVVYNDQGLKEHFISDPAVSRTAMSEILEAIEQALGHSLQQELPVFKTADMV